MKKYHFYVHENFVGEWFVCERGRGHHFCVCFPTKYRAQKVVKWLWKHWKNKSPCLEALKSMVLQPHYKNDWKRLNNLILAYPV